MLNKRTLLGMNSSKKELKMDTIMFKKTKSQGLCLIILLVLLFSAIPALNLWADVFTVTNTDDSGPGSLRQAILDANANPGTDNIHFNIPGTGPHTIQPTSALPNIYDPVIIDGYTQPGANPNSNPFEQGNNAVLMIELDGSLAGNVNGLFLSAGNSIIRGLTINRFARSGIFIRINGNNIIEGNFIGTDISGTTAQGNSHGIYIFSSSNNIIGGTAPHAQNILSGNTYNGILIIGEGTTDAEENKVIGNLIGTDITGSISLPNQTGVNISQYAPNNSIGDSELCAGNLISGNIGRGIDIKSDNNFVKGNLIGTDITGTHKVRNGIGISTSSCSGVLIGGTTPGSGNIISGNQYHGINMDASNASILGNFIGVQKDGSTPLGNAWNGIRISEYSTHCRIGDTSPGADNIIAYNGTDGVGIYGDRISVVSNSIYSNNGLGIDLPPDGTNPNDPGDGDTGANNLQNFPVLSSFSTYTYGTDISGTLNSTPNTNFTLEFFSNPECDPSGYGEGKNFLCRETVTTDVNGDVSFTVIAPMQVPTDYFVTATATDPDGNTSEFALCVTGSAPDIEVSPLSYDFGDVAIGTSSILIITITNVGDADLDVFFTSPQPGWNDDFQITSAPYCPVILPPTASTEVKITYTPSVEKPVESVLEISSSDLDESLVEVQLSGTGVATTPEEQIENTITFFDESVEDGSLVGTGEGESAENRLNALRNMLLEAQRLIDAGDYEAACEQLYSAYLKCDGEPNPPDFVEGESRDELAEMIWDLMQDLGCEQCLAKRYASEPENETVVLPTEFALEQNRPNPFNPTTTISYTVAKDSHVRLTVYNTLGQVVTVLVNGFQAQGSYNVMWNAKGQPSGFYIYLLEADGFSAAKKMFLQK